MIIYSNNEKSMRSLQVEQSKKRKKEKQGNVLCVIYWSRKVMPDNAQSVVSQTLFKAQSNVVQSIYVSSLRVVQ